MNRFAKVLSVGVLAVAAGLLTGDSASANGGCPCQSGGLGLGGLFSRSSSMPLANLGNGRVRYQSGYQAAGTMPPVAAAPIGTAYRSPGAWGAPGHARTWKPVSYDPGR